MLIIPRVTGIVYYICILGKHSLFSSHILAPGTQDFPARYTAVDVDYTISTPREHAADEVIAFLHKQHHLLQILSFSEHQG